MTVARGRRGLLLVDSGSSPAVAARIDADVQRLGEVRWVVNTHAHYVHTFGNQHFVSDSHRRVDRRGREGRARAANVRLGVLPHPVAADARGAPHPGRRTDIIIPGHGRSISRGFGVAQFAVLQQTAELGRHYRAGHDVEQALTNAEEWAYPAVHSSSQYTEVATDSKRLLPHPTVRGPITDRYTTSRGLDPWFAPFLARSTSRACPPKSLHTVQLTFATI
ncbi:MBL fold metallo-hydrolase [Cryobacterium sp. M91]|uniref:MBL fold metallo-hydrolase n=1 Tax=Cryobacterium sp. M91 TaxID=2048294 RepID=UPI003516F73A